VSPPPSPRFLIAWANIRAFDTPDGLRGMPHASYYQMDVALECDRCGRRGMAYAIDPDQDAPEGFLTRPCPVCRDVPAGGKRGTAPRATPPDAGT